MRIFHSATQLTHAPALEFSRGEAMPHRESPVRVESILAALAAAGFPSAECPEDFGLGPLTRVHATDYVEFLRTAWSIWKSDMGETPAYPTAWPVPGVGSRKPQSIEALLGWYNFDSGTPIVQGTWEAAKASAMAAIGAARAVQAGERVAYALCRPPGHHAAAAMMGGYCYLNNAAIAAQSLRDNGVNRVAIVDVDYHHGNGTQALFYDRADVFFGSLHADPCFGFPYFMGYADETGMGAGEGTTVNLPLPENTGETAWMAALDHLLKRVQAFGADALVVSLGVDTWEGDPLSSFLLPATTFPRIGDRLAGLGLPTAIIQEGGYATAELGENVVAVLRGFEAA
ncbi:MAG: histone deacetylase family protein [Rhodospirillum sp.]|nr:histone deacetylase family protein [Rhodospirillum sp.]MCF8488867.1 histone deacetylase family protein [Rhodospirillum sp.]MCF8502922.1 histone deacetylase family protein [Rhodospirillum sp.]